MALKIVRSEAPNAEHSLSAFEQATAKFNSDIGTQQ